ncbi:protein phosphatase 2C 50-like [Prosopis cineraria]|uniref:protein phosphatase 2C 50-like n=1 Tax=Prosopis cineraria TaxID=364024 RepID=UPI00240FD978|nr:protein phosphatase 2C 50-like [Prosopis cineraria]
MEEISSAVAVPFTLGKLTQDSSVTTTHMEIAGLKLMTNTAALILNPAMDDSENQRGLSSQHQTIEAAEEDNHVGDALVSDVPIGCERDWVGNETHSQKSKEDDFMLKVDFQRPNDSSSQSLAGERSSTLRTNCSEIDSPVSTIKVEDDIVLKPVLKMVSVEMDIEIHDGSRSDGCDSKPSDSLLAMSGEKICRRSYKNGLEWSSGALWGFSSICGRREEMEDAIAVEPQLLQVPSQMLTENHVTENPKYSEARFFGVYDGHGGCQVANYCRERLHSVLIEEIEAAGTSLGEKNAGDNWQDHWRKAFSKCFQRVDDEVDGKGAASNEDNSHGSESSFEPLAPETVGSTAVVAILSQTHIMVANCGDSRAVLCRGKEAIPLSTDHKPNREDEWARIEDAGGRVIQWNGYRVLGVLAVSRSIGDRYLKPWVIPEPEVQFVLREKNDECLIVASDGLWDVMTNEEACQAARNRILLWHKKYGNGNNNGSAEREDGIDPAAQFAAEYLSRLSLQRGSKDNISVIVVDLKAQRKLKARA